MKWVLHVGCGSRNLKDEQPVFADWEEVRLDIEPACNPDILGSIISMPAVADASVDAVWCEHNLEHVFWHEVPVALREFRRVLRGDGFCVIVCPDIREICRRVAEGRSLVGKLYESLAGPIAPMDVLYGHRPSVADGAVHMAHKIGFDREVLQYLMAQAEFYPVVITARPDFVDLWCVGFKERIPRMAAWEIFTRYTGVPLSDV